MIKGLNKNKEKAETLMKQIDDENTPEWKRRQLEAKLAMFLRKVAPHKITNGGTYHKEEKEKN